LTEEASEENGRENSPDNVNQLEQKVAEFEQIVAQKENEIAALKKAEGEMKEKLSTVSKSLTEAVVRYKDKIVQMNPGITEELISGDTIEAVDKSLEKAINLIGRVKKSVEKEISNIRVPAGAPGRRIPDLSTLSPREKIQYAIGGKK
jgi:cell division septum initiation protein DivIVA